LEELLPAEEQTEEAKNGPPAEKKLTKMQEDHLQSCSLKLSSIDNNNDDKVLALIYKNESNHFTLARMGMYLFNFICLIIAQTVIKNATYPLWVKIVTFFVYAVLMGFMTRQAVNEVNHHGVVKQRSRYVYDDNDLVFSSM